MDIKVLRFLKVRFLSGIWKKIMFKIGMIPLISGCCIIFEFSSYLLLQNGSFLNYESSIGIWIWPLTFFFLLKFYKLLVHPDLKFIFNWPCLSNYHVLKLATLSLFEPQAELELPALPLRKAFTSSVFNCSPSSVLLNL